MAAAGDAATLVQYLSDTMSPEANQRKQAERYLEAIGKTPGCLPLYMQLMASHEV
jgi:hypothetical protein